MKKIVSLIIILILLILPFGFLIDTKAVGVAITTNNAVSKEGDPNSKLVTNTGILMVKNVNTQRDDQGNLIAGDTFSAYKILDTFYDSDANSLTYDFTSDFKRFLNSLDSNDTYKNITIPQYMALTSDRSYICTAYTMIGNSEWCSASYSEDLTNTASTLNVLVSKYASFISNNRGTNGAVYSRQMTTGDYDSSPYWLDARIVDAEVGSYLILPDSLIISNIYQGSITMKYAATYGVMVGNVLIGVDNGEYVINHAMISSKYTTNSSIAFVEVPYSISEAYSILNSGDSEAIEEMRNSMTGSVSFTVGKDFIIESETLFGYNGIAINAHDSIKNNSTVMTKLHTKTISLPTGFTFDYNNVMYIVSGNPVPTERSGDDFYYDNGKIASRISDTQLEYYNNAIVVPVIASTSHTFTAATPVNITATNYELKEPYADIGANPTSSDIESILKEVSITAAAETYGLNINNTNSNNDNLSGSRFNICLDSNCNNIVKSNVNITNGVGSMVGVSDRDTIYLVQTRAPTGYRLADPIEVDLSELTLDNNSNFTVSVTNQPLIINLPSTGGMGTIIYTVVGLVIILGSGIFIIKYKKKNKHEEEVIEVL